MGLAWDGRRLWAGDWETRSLMRLTAEGAIEERFDAPGRVVGMTYSDGVIYAVTSGENDDRSIHRFVPARGAWDDWRLRCPDDTGSQLSWDVTHLWLSQRYDKRALRLATDGTVEQTIDLPVQVTGIHWDGPTLWANLRFDKGTSDITRLSAGGQVLEKAEHHEQSFASLAFDGSGFWMSDLRGPTIVRSDAFSRAAGLRTL